MKKVKAVKKIPKYTDGGITGPGKLSAPKYNFDLSNLSGNTGSGGGGVTPRGAIFSGDENKFNWANAASLAGSTVGAGASMLGIELGDVAHAANMIGDLANLIPGVGKYISAGIKTIGALSGAGGNVDETTGEITKSSGLTRWLGLGRSDENLAQKSNRITNRNIAAQQSSRMQMKWKNNPNVEVQPPVLAKDGGVIPELVHAKVSKGELYYDPYNKTLSRVPGSPDKPNTDDDVDAFLAKGGMVVTNNDKQPLINGKTQAMALAPMIDKPNKNMSKGTIEARDRIIKKVTRWNDLSKTENNKTDGVIYANMGNANLNNSSGGTEKPSLWKYLMSRRNEPLGSVVSDYFDNFVKNSSPTSLDGFAFSGSKANFSDFVESLKNQPSAFSLTGSFDLVRSIPIEQAIRFNPNVFELNRTPLFNENVKNNESGRNNKNSIYLNSLQSGFNNRNLSLTTDGVAGFITTDKYEGFDSPTTRKLLHAPGEINYTSQFEGWDDFYTKPVASKPTGAAKSTSIGKLKSSGATTSSSKETTPQQGNHFRVVDSPLHRYGYTPLTIADKAEGITTPDKMELTPLTIFTPNKTKSGKGGFDIDWYALASVLPGLLSNEKAEVTRLARPTREGIPVGVDPTKLLQDAQLGYALSNYNTSQGGYTAGQQLAARVASASDLARQRANIHQWQTEQQNKNIAQNVASYNAHMQQLANIENQEIDINAANRAAAKNINRQNRAQAFKNLGNVLKDNKLTEKDLLIAEMMLPFVSENFENSEELMAALTKANKKVNRPKSKTNKNS